MKKTTQKQTNIHSNFTSYSLPAMKEYLTNKYSDTEFKICPFCDGKVSSIYYLAKHTKIWCKKADFPLLSRSQLSQLINTIRIETGKKSKLPADDQDELFKQITQFISFKITGRTVEYQVELENGRIVNITNSQLQTTKIGSALAKKAYRYRKQGKIPHNSTQQNSNRIASLQNNNTLMAKVGLEQRITKTKILSDVVYVK